MNLLVGPWDCCVVVVKGRVEVDRSDLEIRRGEGRVWDGTEQSYLVLRILGYELKMKNKDRSAFMELLDVWMTTLWPTAES